MKDLIRAALSPARATLYRMTHRSKPSFDCPLCGYHGPFRDVNPFSGVRRHVSCPRCLAGERHRLQWLVMGALPEKGSFGRMRMLHFAPETFFSGRFRSMFKGYVTADLFARGVDVKADLRRLPFKDGDFDFFFASHVLEHVTEDSQALSEIRRVLSGSGIAVLPVPIVGDQTVEYPAPVASEAYHVRAPGPDYYDRYSRWFTRVKRYSSGDFDPRFQTHIYEDRSRWPTPEMPYRRPSAGERHEDIVPVCYV